MKLRLTKKIFMVSFMASVLALTGCASQENSTQTNQVAEGITVTHEMGTTVLEKEAEHIAVLELSFLDALYNLDIQPVAIADDGKSDKVTAVTNGEITEYVSVGNRKEPNLEELSTLELDLIIADTTRHSEIYEALSKIAPTIVLDSIDSDYDTYLENFTTIAQVVGESEKAEEKIHEAEALMEDIKVQVEEKVGNQAVLTVSPKNDEYTAHTSSSFVGQVLEKAGFTNAIQSDEKEASLSLEQLVEIDPEIIVYMREDIDTTIYSQWCNTALYQSLQAVQNDNVFTTVARGPWTQYRGFISVNTLMNEMSGWLLEH